MQLCRECDAVLWHRHESCPTCRAQSPHARVAAALPGARMRHGRLVVAIAVATPVVLVVVDQALRWLLLAS